MGKTYKDSKYGKYDENPKKKKCKTHKMEAYNRKQSKFINE